VGAATGSGPVLAEVVGIGTGVRALDREAPVVFAAGATGAFAAAALAARRRAAGFFAAGVSSAGAGADPLSF